MCFQQRQDHGPLAATLTGYNDSGTTPRRRLASDIHWADLGDADGSRPAKRRPVLVMQSASFNASRLATVMVAAISSNTALAAMPGNVFLPAAVTGLQRDSVVNVTAVVTLTSGVR